MREGIFECLLYSYPPNKCFAISSPPSKKSSMKEFQNNSYKILG
jgi:hypothetical protein